MLIGWLVVLFLLLLACNIPVSFVLLMISTIYIIVKDVPLAALGHVLTTSTDSFILSAIPLFILAAYMMDKGDVSNRIIDFSRDLVGHLPGGLAHVNVVANMIVAGMSGSALADAGGIGVVAVKMMRRGGYDDDFTAAITASASIIGPIIPPSIPLVLYGAIARESVGKLFLGGAIPGVLVGVSLMVYIYIVARKRNYPVTPRPTMWEILVHCRRVFLPILTPLIILGGIVGGFFTPTEAAAVACLYAFILGKFIYKAMSWKDCFKAFFDTAVLTGVVVFIMGMAALWSWMITNEGLATLLVEYMTSLTKNPLIMLFLMNLILLILGCFIEPLAIMIMILPVFLPILKAYEISTLHFGVVMTLALMIGLLTPPFGECLFLLSAITGLPVGRVASAVAPCLIYITAVLVLITIFPGFVTWLPSLLM
jgi:tripartite ATP-independent transporter DctM subunit